MVGMGWLRSTLTARTGLVNQGLQIANVEGLTQAAEAGLPGARQTLGIAGGDDDQERGIAGEKLAGQGQPVTAGQVDIADRGVVAAAIEHLAGRRDGAALVGGPAPQ